MLANLHMYQFDRNAHLGRHRKRALSSLPTQKKGNNNCSSKWEVSLSRKNYWLTQQPIGIMRFDAGHEHRCAPAHCTVTIQRTTHISYCVTLRLLSYAGFGYCCIVQCRSAWYAYSIVYTLQ